LIEASANLVNTVIIPPVYISAGVTIENSVVGPHVSVGKGTKIVNSVIKNSIIQQNATLEGALVADSMVGNFAIFHGRFADLSVGDYNVIK
jgi:glucose-1-phosphate thymidylyltransferase